ncbi:MAG TPA: radical SAM protein [Bryobacteraceae bacterium]|nr:radical SAM protein [Bryobacteraceae bacterium]
MAEHFRIFAQPARSILTATSGFLQEAGFTHSLTPARNCTFGCTYCYVPTMRVYGGLKPEDWQRWGQFTTFKENAADLLRRTIRPSMVIYCSPLVDPYQPAEAERRAMPAILDVLITRPPRVFTIQTRGPLILRDLEQLQELNRRTTLRVSFSITTNREDIRKLYEPHCAPIPERLAVIRQLESHGITAHATLAPLLPADPEKLVDAAVGVSPHNLVGDALHLRATKRHGATTREQAFRVAAHHGQQEWFEPDFQALTIQRMKERARAAGRRFQTGPEAFAWLAQAENLASRTS